MSEPKFTPEEAQRIVELSIRLQSQWSDHVSLSEIQNSAAEFGVDPQFVNLAVQQLNTESVTPPKAPKQGQLAGLQVFLGLFIGVYALATWIFGVSLSTSFTPARFPDLAPFLIMAGIFGVVAGAQKRPWLAVVLPVTTVAMTIAALVFTAIRHSYSQSIVYVFDGMAASLVSQAVVLAAGYGLARLVIALNTKPTQRSFTG